MNMAAPTSDALTVQMIEIDLLAEGFVSRELGEGKRKQKSRRGLHASKSSISERSQL
jgi:hypothetical protein